MNAAPGLRLVEREGAAFFDQVPVHEGSADISGELRWDLAMRRRGLAMDVAGLMTYDTHSQWHEAMKRAYLSSPPPGYIKPNWTQLRNADR